MPGRNGRSKSTVKLYFLNRTLSLNFRGKSFLKRKKKKIQMKKSNNNLKLAIAILTLVVAGLLAYIFYPEIILQKIGSFTIPNLSTSGYSKIVDIKTRIVGDESEITLTSGCYMLQAVSDPYVVESIQKGLDEKSDSRPNAHQIIGDAFSALNVDVLMVKINEVKENAFFGKLIIRQGNTILNLDAKPSDAVAIAVRTNSSIYIRTDLLQEKGKYIC